MSQTSYGKQSAHACVLGQLDGPENAEVVSGVVSATDTVSFGDLLEQDAGTQTDAFKLFDGTGRVEGVCLYDANKQTGTYAPKDAINILRKGRVWLASVETIAVGSPHPLIAASRVLRTGVDNTGATRYLTEINLPASNSVSP
jgi:hypothetical protein